MNMTVDPEEVFPQVEKMIYSQAWKFAKQYPIPFEEARSNAYASFMEACARYNPHRKAKFSTWCNFLIWCNLMTEVTRRAKEPIVFVEIVDEEVAGAAPLLSESFAELMEDVKASLSEDAKTILSLLLETPADLLGGIRPTPKQLMTRVKKALKAAGKNQWTIHAAQLELQRGLSVAWR